jgi:hypothetical protein
MSFNPGGLRTYVARRETIENPYCTAEVSFDPSC